MMSKQFLDAYFDDYRRLAFPTEVYPLIEQYRDRVLQSPERCYSSSSV